MKAVILAGGKGTRLMPYTTVLPKPLLPVGEKAILEILISQIVKFGVDEIILCVNHLAEIIMAFLGDGSKWGIKIRYSIEDKPLNTVAPLKLIEDLPDSFLVLNGDLLTNLDFRALYEYHLSSKELLTVATYKKKTKIDFGVFNVNDKTGCVTAFSEKPELNHIVGMGIYVFEKRLLDYVPLGKAFGFDELILELIKLKLPVKNYSFEGYWTDIGRCSDYDIANQDVERLNLG